MARPIHGQEVWEIAQSLLSQAHKADELRMLQAVVLPFSNGMTTKQVSEIIGRSVRWVSSARRKFIDNPSIALDSDRFSNMRNRAYMTISQEKEFLAPFFESAQSAGILTVSRIHQALEQHLGRKVALASAYNMLHRHNWRKLAPDKRHVKADVQAQEEWKKNSQKPSPTSKIHGKTLESFD